MQQPLICHAVLMRERIYFRKKKKIENKMNDFEYVFYCI